MKTHNSSVKVRYGETDQMGVVYHGNYAQYLEVARIEWLSDLGVSYKKMEENGVMLPVYDMRYSFLKPAFFDDLLTVKTTLRKIPRASIVFDYEIYNQNQELLTRAETTLVFVDMKTNRPTRCPQYILDLLLDQDAKE
ncbi:acyl-CoA thioesterase [Leeuwenhoekiella palythoae]|uniref:Acyl-CoA thioester hydrolase n=1 Tax=Leeuwenhoekiella palythoae TaxID=573501 RepID=A0A1M5XZY8_9FLAO|nr:thioesterase family protein [Leeuwenhoekiella palythoae]MBH12897.1 acyl-CoA thioesterase [Leeuwenhoekiella sp.]MEC7783754.1 thioesterase family protein [Bacteroidota bacterium]MEE3149121.1 thioesterase family protein [Bacteroidota bacterium]MEE3225802.1 thioesterase family protein [Bacteroidota bacterium]MEE3245355.1 thioesterase family protein [Bacteroidota bacterium]|tara:strand:+ start:343 stop:756 length:414 start_codon:yes stop_codon:yes gene_type:complete